MIILKTHKPFFFTRKQYVDKRSYETDYFKQFFVFNIMAPYVKIVCYCLSVCENQLGAGV